MPRAKTDTSDRPTHSCRVETYAEFRDDVAAFASGQYNFLMVLGWAGIGKTETALQTLPEDEILYIRTKLSAYEFYCLLWEATKEGKKFVVVDDVKALFSSKDCVALLTALTETKKVKRISWHTASVGNSKGRKDDDGDEIPAVFPTELRLLLIVNEWKTLGEDVRALESRGACLMFHPSPIEVHLEVHRGGWFKDQEVYDFMYQHLAQVVKPSLRHYVAASEQRRANRPWQKRLIEWIIGDERLQQIAQLLADPRFKSETARAKEYERRGWGSDRNYWRLRKEFQWYGTSPLGTNPKL